MGTNTYTGWDLKKEWLDCNKEELLDSISKTEEKLTTEIKQKEEEMEVLRIMRDMINTMKEK